MCGLRGLVTYYSGFSTAWAAYASCKTVEDQYPQSSLFKPTQENGGKNGLFFGYLADSGNGPHIANLVLSSMVFLSAVKNSQIVDIRIQPPSFR